MFFWQWSTFRSYYVFYVYSMLVYALVYFTFNWPAVVEFTGLLCQLCDGLVAFPQAYRNFAKKSVKNVRYAVLSSYLMIVLWFLGDACRLAFYYFKDQPLQFVLGGLIAVLMDLVVLGQFRAYKHDPEPDPHHVNSSEEN